jgi:hypothetical protein
MRVTQRRYPKSITSWDEKPPELHDDLIKEMQDTALRFALDNNVISPGAAVDVQRGQIKANIRALKMKVGADKEAAR